MSKITEYLKKKAIEIERENNIENLRIMALRSVAFSCSQSKNFEICRLGADNLVGQFETMESEKVSEKKSKKKSDSENPENYKFADKE